METDITMQSQMIIELYHLVLELVERLRKADFKGKTLTLKIKYSDFTIINRGMTAPKVLTTKEDILPLAKLLLKKVDYSAAHPVRLVGLSVSNPATEDDRPKWVQGWLDFGEDWSRTKR